MTATRLVDGVFFDYGGMLTTPVRDGEQAVEHPGRDMLFEMTSSD